MIMREDINSTIYEKRRREKNLVLTLTWMMKCVSHDDFFIFKVSDYPEVDVIDLR